MPPRPTTAVSRQSTQLQPHSDSHDAEGDDPVLGQIIYHGSSALGGDYTLTGTLADTGMSLVVHSRGGQLMIIMSNGFRDVLYSGVARSDTNITLTTQAFVGSTGLASYVERSSESFSSAIQTSLWSQWCSAQEWLTTQLPGAYTVKIQAKYGGDATAGQIDTGTTMQVFELLPLRR